MKIDLRDEVLKEYDVHLRDELKEHWNSGSDGGFGQYNVLAHLSTYFNDDIIIDIGTGHEAVSARALSYNETNVVYSYDIEFNENAHNHIERLDNVEYDVFNPFENSKARELMLSASLISLDVEPHDGIKEKEFVQFFVINDWRGIMVCDDIHMGKGEPGCNNFRMAAFWEDVDKTKYDISDNNYAHRTGTGIICFDNQEVII